MSYPCLIREEDGYCGRRSTEPENKPANRPVAGRKGGRVGSVRANSSDCKGGDKKCICAAREITVKFDTIWRSRRITEALKEQLMKALVWSIFHYRAESCTIKRRDGNRRNVMLALNTWSQLESVLEELGYERELMRKVAKLKLQYFRHLVISLAVLEGMIPEWSDKTYKELKAIAQDHVIQVVMLTAGIVIVWLL